MDLKRLGHLLALAEERHFARAAERVHLSQPAFSRSIQSIERDVGMRLVDRAVGEVKLTPAGQFLVERAKRLLFDSRSLQRDVALYRDSQLGDTAFGAGPIPAATIMPLALPALRSHYPDVGLRLETSNWRALLERLLGEDIEFFVAELRDLPDDPRIEKEALGRQPGYLFARAGHPLAGRPCSFRQAWEFGIAANKLPKPIKTMLAHLLGLPPGEELVLALQCDDMALLRILGASTDTVIATSLVALRDDVRAGVMVQLDVEDLPSAYVEMGIVTLANRSPSPMAQRAMACIREIAEGLNVPVDR
ncbi:MAG TPA: LysR family transcriptional regulator [Burkholderiaceae bacterium]